jgi:hypothetical protein
MPTALLGLLLLVQAPSNGTTDEPAERAAQVDQAEKAEQTEPAENDPAADSAALDQEGPRYGIGAHFDWSFSNSEKGPLNASYYGDNLLKLLRVSLLFNFQASERVGLYVNLTSENGGSPHLYGAFVRLAPFSDQRFWIQAGKIPQAFGAFPERWYPFANPLVGNPLMYSYLTSLQPYSVPADVDDLLSQRGNGFYSQFQGDPPHAGMPMIQIFRWAAGGIGYGSVGPFQYLGGVTAGSASNPLQVDDDGGSQVLGRARYLPSPAFNAGVSAAYGPYLSNISEEALDGRSRDGFHQTAIGGDFQYARGHLLLYGETAWSRWESPNIAEPLDTVSAFVETRYRLLPGVYAAGRLDRMSFGDVTARDGRRESWDYSLSRLELASGFSWERHVLLKVAGQFNWYDDRTDLNENIIVFQIVVHF